MEVRDVGMESREEGVGTEGAESWGLILGSKEWKTGRQASGAMEEDFESSNFSEISEILRLGERSGKH